MLSISVFLISCTKSGYKEKNDKLLVDEVMAIKNSDAQRLSFSELLNPEQKSELWHGRINQMMKENVLNQSQKNLLISLKSNLSAKVFQDKDQRDIFMNNFGLKWQQDAIQIIGVELMYKYLVNINNSSTANSEELDELGDGTSSCNCNQTSSVSCLGRDECTSTTCKTSDYGCGVLWLWSCNGRCRLT